jgi:hypothetical protein
MFSKKGNVFPDAGNNDRRSGSNVGYPAVTTPESRPARARICDPSQTFKKILMFSTERQKSSSWAVRACRI